MRVLLADDHRLLVEGLQNLLEAHGVEVVGIARDGLEAAAQATAANPDVILMDLRMPVCDGLAATRLIKSEMPDTKIVMLTTSSDERDLFEAVRSGASGYLLKSMDAESLMEALRDVEQGIPPFAPGMAAKLLAEFARSAEAGAPPAPETARGAEPRWSSPAPEQPGGTTAAAPEWAGTQSPGTRPSAELYRTDEEPLSARQIEVLTLVAEGLSYKEVGARACLSPRTVKYHMAEIMRKLHMQNRAQVLAYAARMSGPGDVQQPR